MVVDRISYKKIFPIGSYLTEHIGLEASLTEGDNPETELSHLKQMVNELHSATIADLEEYRGTKVTDVTPVNNTIKGIIEDIGNCKEISIVNTLGVEVGLEAYLEMADKYPEIQVAYNKKFTELINKQL